MSHLATVSTPKLIGLEGLDNINAFDKAEVDGINFGQLNMIKVSSFCGPRGKIAGLDFLQKEKVLLGEVEGIQVNSAESFMEVSKDIIGTVENKKFPILPGSHVPCAGKYIFYTGPEKIYSMFAVGIPEDQENYARLFMEDVGKIENGLDAKEYQMKVAKSVIEVFKNQQIELKEVYTAIRILDVSAGETGCALVMLPYIKLARKFFSQ